MSQSLTTGSGVEKKNNAEENPENEENVENVEEPKEDAKVAKEEHAENGADEHVENDRLILKNYILKY
jgi:hypothetical protein